jgi:hypothetical protein
MVCLTPTSGKNLKTLSGAPAETRRPECFADTGYIGEAFVVKI